MFHVTLQTLVLTYLILILGSVFVLWTVDQTLRWLRARRDRRNRLVCQVCGFIYEDYGPDTEPPCPECGRPNERQLFQDL